MSGRGCGAPRGLWLGVALALFFPLAAAAETTVYAPPDCGELRGQSGAEALLRCFAPVIVAHGTEATHNRIGTPRLSRGALGGLALEIDASAPTVFAELRADAVAGVPVHQLVYRIHFEKIPLRFSPRFFEAHDNTSLLVLLTLDARDRRPLFLSTVHGCGCYLALAPTGHFPREALPTDWPDGEQRIHGERVSARVDVPAGAWLPRIELAPDSHRVTDMLLAARAPDEATVALELEPMDALRDAPVAGGERGERGSVFYVSGPLRGHVRGAWNPLEGLTVFGVVALDPTVGMDKDFGDPDATGTPFYTEISFFAHQRSRLDRFDRLLRARGFRLAR